MTTCFIPASEAVQIGAKPGRTEQEAFFLREVAEGREGEEIIFSDPPRELASVKRCGDFVVRLLTKGLRQRGIFTPLRIDRAEEPELVAFDRAAQVKPGVNF